MAKVATAWAEFREDCGEEPIEAASPEDGATVFVEEPR